MPTRVRHMEVSVSLFTVPPIATSIITTYKVVTELKSGWRCHGLCLSTIPAFIWRKAVYNHTHLHAVSLTVYYTIKLETTTKNVFSVWFSYIDVVCLNLLRSGGEASPILGLSTKWWRVVSFTLWPLYTWTKSPWVLTGQEIGWAPDMHLPFLEMSPTVAQQLHWLICNNI
jgi:hypothetical protein